MISDVKNATPMENMSALLTWMSAFPEQAKVILGEFLEARDRNPEFQTPAGTQVVREHIAAFRSFADRMDEIVTEAERRLPSDG